jgi:hypothetical protein
MFGDAEPLVLKQGTSFMLNLVRGITIQTLG